MLCKQKWEKVYDGNCSKDMESLVRNTWEVMWDGKMTTEFWVRDPSQSLWPFLAYVAFWASCLLHLYKENSTISDLYLLREYNLRNNPKSQWFTTISIPFSLINLQVTWASFLSDEGCVQGCCVSHSGVQSWRASITWGISSYSGGQKLFNGPTEKHGI